jgi:hypothetical protein
MPICSFALISSTQCLQNDLPQVLCIVVFARDERIQAASQPINGRLVGGVIFVWENDVEASIQSLCGDISEVLRDEGEGNEVGGRCLPRERQISSELRAFDASRSHLGALLYLHA